MRHRDAAEQPTEKPSALVVDDRRARCDRGGEKRAPDRRYQPAMESPASRPRRSRRRRRPAPTARPWRPANCPAAVRPPWSRRPQLSERQDQRRDRFADRRRLGGSRLRQRRIDRKRQGEFIILNEVAGAAGQRRHAPSPAGTGPVGYNRSEAAGAPTRTQLYTSERTILSHRSCRWRAKRRPGLRPGGSSNSTRSSRSNRMMFCISQWIQWVGPHSIAINRNSLIQFTTAACH